MYVISPCCLHPLPSPGVAEQVAYPSPVLDRDLRLRLEWLARRTLHHEHDVQDVVQETLVRALACAHTVRDPRAFRGWVRVILRNVMLDTVRRRARRTTVPLEDAGALPDRREPPPGTTVELREALSRLPAAHRRIVSAVAEGHCLREIARADGVSYAAAKTRLYRARVGLRDALAG